MPTPTIQTNFNTTESKMKNLKLQSTVTEEKKELSPVKSTLTPTWNTTPSSPSRSDDTTSPNSSPTKSYTSDEQPQQLKSELYKTEICKKWEEEGFCKYGKRCQYAHGRDELRTVNRHIKYKSKLCNKYHTTGVCAYGQRCIFIHRVKHEHKRLSTFIDTCSDKIKLDCPSSEFKEFDETPDTRYDQLSMDFIHSWKGVKLI